MLQAAKRELHLPKSFLLASNTDCMYNVWAEVIFQDIQCLLNFQFDVGHQGLDVYPHIKFCVPQCFSLSLTCKYTLSHSTAVLCI